MRIVIDIDDEDYKRIHDIPDVFNSLTSRTYSAIKNGTPLPKGHGRLIDADAYVKKYDTNINGRIGEKYVFAPTIVEADMMEVQDGTD